MRNRIVWSCLIPMDNWMVKIPDDHPSTVLPAERDSYMHTLSTDRGLWKVDERMHEFRTREELLIELGYHSCYT